LSRCVLFGFVAT
jgi:hypothetical protein